MGMNPYGLQTLSSPPQEPEAVAAWLRPNGVRDSQPLRNWLTHAALALASIVVFIMPYGKRYQETRRYGDLLQELYGGA